MIKLTRVDYRLIHGQVAMSWTHALDVDCILCASDAVAKDDMRKAALRLARPSGVKLVIKDVDAAIEALNSGVTDLLLSRRSRMPIALLRVAKTSRRSIWAELESLPRPRFIRPPRSLRPKPMPSISKSLSTMAWLSKSVRSPMTQRYLPRTFSSWKHAIVWHLLIRSSFLKPVDHLIGGLFIKEKSKKSEIVLA